MRSLHSGCTYLTMSAEEALVCGGESPSISTPRQTTISKHVSSTPRLFSSRRKTAKESVSCDCPQHQPARLHQCTGNRLGARRIQSQRMANSHGSHSPLYRRIQQSDRLDAIMQRQLSRWFRAPPATTVLPVDSQPAPPSIARDTATTRSSATQVNRLLSDQAYAR